MKTREDEIRYLIYLKGQLIKQTKKEIQNLTYELSNTRQTGILTNAINNQTSEILNAQGKYYMNAPCYQGCGGCCNGLY